MRQWLLEIHWLFRRASRNIFLQFQWPLRHWFFSLLWNIFFEVFYACPCVHCTFLLRNLLEYVFERLLGSLLVVPWVLLLASSVLTLASQHSWVHHVMLHFGRKHIDCYLFVEGFDVEVNELKVVLALDVGVFHLHPSVVKGEFIKSPVVHCLVLRFLFVSWELLDHLLLNFCKAHGVAGVIKCLSTLFIFLFKQRRWCIFLARIRFSVDALLAVSLKEFVLNVQNLLECLVVHVDYLNGLNSFLRCFYTLIQTSICFKFL